MVLVGMGQDWRSVSNLASGSSPSDVRLEARPPVCLWGWAFISAPCTERAAMQRWAWDC